MTPYFIGLGLSVLASAITLFLKSSFSQYPGAGDLTLAYFFAEATDIRSAVALYAPKALLAALLFSLLYLPFRADRRLAFQGALAVTILVLVLMSLGQVVVA